LNEPATILKVFLDEGVPHSVGANLTTEGHNVIYLAEAIKRGSPDQVVCKAAMENDAILIAHDSDMRTIARSHGIGQSRFRRLNLLKLSCKKTRSASRVAEALRLLVHEWNFGDYKRGRQLDMEVRDTVIRLNR